MINLESMINKIVRLRPLPVILDKHEHSKPLDVDWVIRCSLLQESKEFWLQTVSGTKGFRLPIEADQVVRYHPEKSADLKSASEGILTINRSWKIFPEGKPAENVPVSNTLTEH